jgi:prepilin-type N-terminal cleavage/methylation domain-containing protein
MSMPRLAPRSSCHHRLCCRGRHRSFHGFTLVELLVVIAIIGTLVGLLLPAVQAAREAARRSTCANTMKQWGLAMNNYHDAYRVLPLGASSFPCVQQIWMPVLWPFIERAELASKYNYRGLIQDWPNVTAPTSNPPGPLSSRLPIYYCPSDRPNAYHRVSSGNSYTAPRINYVVNSTVVTIAGTKRRGPFAKRYDNEYKGCQGSGWVGFEPRGFSGSNASRYKDITDGLSKTLLMSEINVWSGDDNQTPPVDPRGVLYWFSYFDATITPNSSFDTVASWYTGASYVCNNSPPNLPCQATGVGDTFKFAARSKHIGGVQAVTADGAVRFFSDDVDTAVWQAMGTINGGESLGY